MRRRGLERFAITQTCAATGSIRHNGRMRADSICRTAVYVTRSYGGVGEGSREVFPYPDWASRRLSYT